MDGRSPDALLLEVFTGEGVGTMIVDRKEAGGSGSEAGDPGAEAADARNL